MIVLRLLADQRSNLSLKAADLDMKNEVGRFAGTAANGERDISSGLDGNMNELRLVRRRDKGEFCLGSGRKDIHEEVRRKAVRYIRREVDMLLHDCSVFSVVGNLAAQRSAP